MNQCHLHPYCKLAALVVLRLCFVGEVFVFLVFLTFGVM